MKRVVVDGLRMLQERFEVCLIGYVVMPEHVHVLLYPHTRSDHRLIAISKLLHSFKKHVGFHGKRTLRDIWRRHGGLWSEPLNRWAKGQFSSQSIWNVRGHDSNIDRHDMLLAKLDYCHKNPVSRGIVDIAGDWPWSSYRYYELGDSTLLAMDWDGRWPIVW